MEEMLAAVLKETLVRTKIDPALVGDIVVGSVLGGGSQRATEARMAMFLAGYPDSVPVHTINRQCSSGLQALAHVAANINAGYYVRSDTERHRSEMFVHCAAVTPVASLSSHRRRCLPFCFDSPGHRHRRRHGDDEPGEDGLGRRNEPQSVRQQAGQGLPAADGNHLRERRSAIWRLAKGAGWSVANAAPMSWLCAAGCGVRPSRCMNRDVRMIAHTPRLRVCCMPPDLLSEFAVTSHRKAAAAIKAGKFKDEIVPMTVQVRMHDQTVQPVRWRLMWTTACLWHTRG